MLPSCCPARAAASGTGQGRRAIVTRGHRVATWHCSPYLYTFYGKEHVEYRTKDRVSSYVGLRCGIRVIPYTCVKRLVSTALQLTVYFQSSDERRDPGETQSQIRARRGRPRPISEVSASPHVSQPWYTLVIAARVALYGLRAMECTGVYIYLYNLSKKEKENDLTHVSRRVLLLVRVVASASSI